MLEQASTLIEKSYRFLSMDDAALARERYRTAWGDTTVALQQALTKIESDAKVIAALRKGIDAAIDRFEGCGMRYGADEIRKLCGVAIEQNVGKSTDG